MRMILPNWLMTINSEVSSTSRIEADLSDLWSCLQVIDSLSGARGETVFVDVRALSEAVLGDGEDQEFADSKPLVKVFQSFVGVV